MPKNHATHEAEPSPRAQPTPASPDLIKAAYLDFVERAPTFSLYGATDERIGWKRLPRSVRVPLDAIPDRLGLPSFASRRAIRESREEGHDWPVFAQTMIGSRRLAILRTRVARVIADEIQGDLIEAGVWRGGPSIMMRAVLKAYGSTNRAVVLADSFARLPRPRAADDSHDRMMRWDTFSELAVSEAEVRAKVEQHGLLDDQVRFVRGWCRDTTPSLADGRWSVVRLDGDNYSPTMDARTALFPGLMPGGGLIVDDHGSSGSCHRAVDEFRRTHGVEGPTQRIGWTGVLGLRGDAAPARPNGQDEVCESTRRRGR
jgi:hypothetical protein